MKGKKKTKTKRSFFLRFALLAFAVYIVVILVQLQMDISDKQDRIDELDQKIVKYNTENEELIEQGDNYKDYLEKKAREQGMLKPGESVYIETP